VRKKRSIFSRFRAYIYDPSIPVKDRAFIMFSATVLIALAAAIPCGIIMREPLMATVSTVVGLVFFLAYVLISFKRNTIYRARVVISIILVFFFLPAMFFTNGGVYGGTPIWLLLGTIYIAMILEGKLKIVMIVCDAILMTTCWIVGYYRPGLITSYTRGGNYFDTIAALLIVGAIIYSLITFQNRLYRNEEERKSIERLFAQTATALVNAIDAKDKYTHGHSARVAEYSRRIAEKAGKSPMECEEIYYIALLHDVGKIGIPASIINKEGKLSDEEYETIKQHPVLGAQILKGITEYPRLSIGANYHHERYDGKGYPEHLIGTDIPEIARIISVADAYDAMTSRRSYRDPIPQQNVREEIVKGIGTQFDPDFARIMVHFIDMDIEYQMMEREESRELGGKDELIVGEYRSAVSEGIVITQAPTTIRMKIRPDRKGRSMRPSMIIFDALDAHFHDNENEIKDLLYFEYGELAFDGESELSGARKIETKHLPAAYADRLKPDEYIVEALRIRDHARIRVHGKQETVESIIALPDSARFSYIGLSGEHCVYSEIDIEKAEEEAAKDEIPRIAEEISYITGPAGDVPNVQIDGYRTDSTKGILIKDGLKITFHGKSLPTARLVWHCPFIDVFDSDDGTVTGENYRDFTLMRLDGECWEADPNCSIKLVVNRTDAFEGWDAWKEFLRKGFDCTVTFERKDNTITVKTENAGIVIRNTSVLKDNADPVYAALSGDQCALTNIRISYPPEAAETQETQGKKKIKDKGVKEHGE